MFKATVACAVLLASLAVVAEELPVRDPMRPYGRDAATAGGALATAAGPRFVLTGIVISPTRRVAIVNGRAYRQGQSVDGAEIVAVEPGAVTLRDGGTELVIPLGPAAKSRRPNTQGETVP